MRIAIVIAVLSAVLGFAVLWTMGVFDTISAFAFEQQREGQNALARGLRALRSGEPGALLAVLGLAFSYGFFHAAGPGHGKILIGGYGLARRVNALRLSALALASSLAQATSAIILVYAGIFVLNWGRERLVGVTENFLAPASYAAIALIGLWLAIRGARRFLAMRAENKAHECGHCCNHRHGPTSEEVAALGGWRDTLMLVGSIAIRPCTGAIFLLVITYAMGVPFVGILGAYAMGIGTSAITIFVALGAVWFRDGLTVSTGNGRLARLAFPTLELAAGVMICLSAFELLRRSL